MDPRAEYSAAIARVVGDAMKAKGLSVLALHELTHIPRVTLTRKLTFPGSSEFSVPELHIIGPHIGMKVSEISAIAEEQGVTAA